MKRTEKKAPFDKRALRGRSPDDLSFICVFCQGKKQVERG